MPSHKLHRFIDRLVLKKEYPLTHKYADAVLGRGHRKVWGHSLFHTALLYLLTKKKEYAISHMLHVLADKLETKNRPLIQLLELALKKSSNRRK